MLTHYDIDTQTRADILQPDYLICNEQNLPADQTPWRGSWQWMLYDIINADQALNWAASGIDLIETAAIGSMLQDPRFKSGVIDHGL